jgi:hypothetical protein
MWRRAAQLEELHDLKEFGRGRGEGERDLLLFKAMV